MDSRDHHADILTAAAGGWAVLEVKGQQRRLERELYSHESQRAELLQQVSSVIAPPQMAFEAFGFGFAKSLAPFLWPTVAPIWTECAWLIERAVRAVDDRIASLKARLRILNRRIQVILSVLQEPRFLYAIVLIHARFYVVHGNRPPRLSGTFVRPITWPGASFA